MARLTIKGLNKELAGRGLAIEREGTNKYHLFDITTDQPEFLDEITGNLSTVKDHIDQYDYETEREAPSEASQSLGLTLNRQFESLKVFTRLMLSGSKNMVMVGGPPGIGKSFEIDEVMRDEDRHYTVISGKTSAVEVYNTLYDHRYSNQVVVFDDCDSAFDNNDAVNILKAATEISHKTGKATVRWNTNYAGIEEKEFDFEGKVVIITNRDFRKANMSKARPLISRSYFIQFHNDREQILERTRMIANTVEGHKTYGLTQQERNEVVDYIAQFNQFIPDLRLYFSIAELASQAKQRGFDWKEVGLSVIESQMFLNDASS